MEGNFRILAGVPGSRFLQVSGVNSATCAQSEIHNAFRSLFVVCIFSLTSNSTLLNSFATFILGLEVHVRSVVGAFNSIIKIP